MCGLAAIVASVPVEGPCRSSPLMVRLLPLARPPFPRARVSGVAGSARASSSRACLAATRAPRAPRRVCRSSSSCSRIVSWASVGPAGVVAVDPRDRRAEQRRARCAPSASVFSRPESSGCSVWKTSSVAASPAAVPRTPSPAPGHVRAAQQVALGVLENLVRARRVFQWCDLHARQDPPQALQVAHELLRERHQRPRRGGAPQSHFEPVQAR